MASPRSSSQRSFFESYLDEHQSVRLALSVGGLALVLVLLALGVRHPAAIPTLVVVGVVAGHAVWCRAKGIRAPTAVLVIDVGLFSALMQTYENAAIVTASAAYLSLLTVFFAQRRSAWAFLVLIAGAFCLAWIRSPDAGGPIELVGALSTLGAMVFVLWRLRSWLQRLDAQRSQMLGTVGHELRNSLTGIIGLMQLVSDMPDIQPVEARELMVLAHGQAADASEIIDDLLTISRLDSDSLRIEASDFDMNHEVSSVVQRFSGTDVKLTTNLAGASTGVLADPLRVRQILRNLISNAERYGGPNVEVTTLVDGGMVETRVHDDGDGVPSEDADTIFLPYRRSVTARRHPGSIGLGLWICRQLAVAMGGSITYGHDSSGTTFSLRLPSSESAGRAAEAADRESPRRPQSCDISKSLTSNIWMVRPA